MREDGGKKRVMMVFSLGIPAKVNFILLTLFHGIINAYDFDVMPFEIENVFSSILGKLRTFGKCAVSVSASAHLFVVVEAAMRRLNYTMIYKHKQLIH